jgi:hypothetical protein
MSIDLRAYHELKAENRFLKVVLVLYMILQIVVLVIDSKQTETPCKTVEWRNEQAICILE